MTEQLKKVLGQVPKPVQERGTAREKLEALWRAIGWARNGAQTRVAGEVADRWHERRETPRLPIDDPRRSAKKLDRLLTGELAMPVDLAMVVIDCLPEPYDQAARALIFPTSHREAHGLGEALEQNAVADNATDLHRFRLARDCKRMGSAELVAIAQAYEKEAESCRQLAEELYALAEPKRANQ